MMRGAEARQADIFAARAPPSGRPVILRQVYCRRHYDAHALGRYIKFSPANAFYHFPATVGSAFAAALITTYRPFPD